MVVNHQNLWRRATCFRRVLFQSHRYTRSTRPWSIIKRRNLFSYLVSWPYNVCIYLYTADLISVLHFHIYYSNFCASLKIFIHFFLFIIFISVGVSFQKTLSSSSPEWITLRLEALEGKTKIVFSPHTWHKVRVAVCTWSSPSSVPSNEYKVEPNSLTSRDKKRVSPPS